MTGQLNFSGTTHAGIKLLSLTTTQRDALTAANGMVIYNTTTATVQMYQNAAWVSVGASGGGITWSAVTGTTQAMAINTGYIANNAALVTLTLPATASVGDVFRVVGLGAGGWRIAQNASQVIHFGNQDTTTGTGGRLDFTHKYDAVEIVCVVANTGFTVISSVGAIAIT